MATKRPHWLVQRSANYSITSFVNNKNQLSPYRSYLQQNKHYWIYQRQYSAKVMQEYTFIVIEHEENFPLSRWLFPIISSFCTNCLARKTGETPDAMFNIESFVSLSNTYVLRNQTQYLLQCVIGVGQTFMPKIIFYILFKNNKYKIKVFAGL